MIHFLFSSGPFNDGAPDEFFAEQMAAVVYAGFSASVCPEAVLEGAKNLKGIPAGRRVVFRGWMVRADEYGRLARAIERAGGVPYTTPTEYLATHHLPNWYPLLADLTPETRVYPADADLADALRPLGWTSFFVKDYVKSLKTSVGSLLNDPTRIGEFVAAMRAYRGEIEGGICVRRVEEFIRDSERRYFVVNGRPFGPDDGNIPDAVEVCARRIASPFFSVDVVLRRDGVMRVVEVGDGQVSDLVGWTPGAFARMWLRSVSGAAK